MSRRITPEYFLEQIKNHQLTILHDDGVYRHIRMMQPDTRDRFYDLITYPGGLVYRGDMGEYLFERMTDMFAFFSQKNLQINSGYWEEKCCAWHRDNVRKFSDDKFRIRIKEIVENWCESFSDDYSEEDLRGLMDEVEEQFTGDDVSFHSEEEARRALDDFDSEYIGKFEFVDMWDEDFSDYTYRFIWCLFAIVYAIQCYDKIKSMALVVELESSIGTFKREHKVD